MSKENLPFDSQSKQIKFLFLVMEFFFIEIENVFSMFLSSFSINQLVFYHKCRSLIGYASHHLFCDNK